MSPSHAANRRAIKFVGGRFPTPKRPDGVQPSASEATAVCRPQVLYADQVVFPSGAQRGAISISPHGRIRRSIPECPATKRGRWAAHQPSSASFLPFPADTAILPGLIDVHTHISELGRDWEGYRSATRAAAAGGVTTLMGMPLNSIPATTSVESLELEVDAACGTSLMADVTLTFGLTVPTSGHGHGSRQLRRQLVG